MHLYEKLNKEGQIELQLQKEINHGLEEEISKVLVQSKKDLNLIHELVIINEIFLEEHAKLKTVINHLHKELKTFKDTVKKSNNPPDNQNTGKRVRQARLEAEIQRKRANKIVKDIPKAEMQKQNIDNDRNHLKP